METVGPNAEQIRYWNETAGPKWVAMDDAINQVIAPIGEHALEAAGVRAGERILDVGCGGGRTTVELARRTGPSGAVTGLDVSGPLLALARHRAADAGLAVTFVEADAQTHPLPTATFDLLFSRFGVMFFADPATAFVNLGRALRPGGRAVFACWQPLPQNAWVVVPLMAAAQHVTLPPPPAADAPGPFALGDPDRVRDILGRAGFRDVRIAPVEKQLTLGRELDATAEFMTQMGPAAAVLREVDAATTTRVVAAIREALVPHQTPDGIRLGSAAWLVTAVRP